MSDYLFVQCQDPFTENRTTHQYLLARQLHEAGSHVSVLLVQNGVIPARRNTRYSAFDQLLSSGVKVFADSFSLQQREIAPESLKTPVTVTELDMVIDALLAGHKVIWN